MTIIILRTITAGRQAGRQGPGAFAESLHPYPQARGRERKGERKRE